jgi:leucyl aminopeptidase
MCTFMFRSFEMTLGLNHTLLAIAQNAGNKYAGSITAALFLQQYVDTEKVQWAHIDIAGCETLSLSA